MTKLSESKNIKAEENVRRVEPVYDLINVGRKNRFWANGKLIHNSGGLNVQNLSSGRKKGQSKALKQSITAPAGYKVIVYDSSQIELRTGGYFAWDTDLLQMFVDGRDPYSELAARMYGGDPTEIKLQAKKDIQPYAQQRQISKSAELSCIYGTGAFGLMSYLKINGITMSQDDCKNVVDVYRQAHPAIANMWKQCERALNIMIAGGEGTFGGENGDMFYFSGNRVIHGEVIPGIRLPDGVWLSYRQLRKEVRTLPDGSERMTFAYTGMKEGRIKTIYTYGAKIFENCIAEDTEVLTARGWVMIQDVLPTDLVFDGVEFVAHEGLMHKSEQDVITVNSVQMTPDHQVLTEYGWRTARGVLAHKLPLEKVKMETI